MTSAPFFDVWSLLASGQALGAPSTRIRSAGPTQVPNARRASNGGMGSNCAFRVFPQRLHDHTSTPDVTGPSSRDDLFKPASDGHRSQFSASWHKALGCIAPQGYEQLSGDGDDCDPTAVLAVAVRPSHEPFSDGASVLKANPAPRQLHQTRSRAVPAQAYPPVYPAWMKKFRQSSGWTSLVAMAQALQRPSSVRLASLRRMVLNLAKACSIGSRSGL